MIHAPLSGLTVLEYPDSVAARYCGRLFAAQGARALQASVPSGIGVGYGAQRARHLRDGWIMEKRRIPPWIRPISIW